MNSGWDTPKGWVSPFGHPRINDRSHLPAAFRSVPRPSSPLGAKASTECPSLTPYQHHRPRTGPIHAPCNYLPISGGSARNIPKARSSLALGRCASLTHTTTDHLHHVKEHAAPPGLPLPSRGSRTASAERNRFRKCRRPQAAHQAPTAASPAPSGTGKWRRSDSNRRPPACKAGALPLSYAPAGEDANSSTQAGQRQRSRITTPPLGGNQILRSKIWWAREDLNLRPHAYQACALTN
jgi:hypothetical protein